MIFDILRFHLFSIIFLIDFFYIVCLLIGIILYDLWRLGFLGRVLILCLVIWSLFLNLLWSICLVVLGLSTLPSRYRLISLFRWLFFCVALIGICYLGVRNWLNRWIIFHRNYRYFHLFFVRFSISVSTNPKLQNYNYIKICTFLLIVIFLSPPSFFTLFQPISWIIIAICEKESFSFIYI